MGSFIDLTDQEFGRLTVMKRAENNKRCQAMWLCECICGVEKIVWGADLRRGRTKSCGCQNIELFSARATTHGLAQHPLYHTWKSMKARCCDPSSLAYKNYGGRGVTICAEWLDNPEAFIDWAMTNGHEKGLEIDRINNDGNYTPENCHFVTRSENQRNTRRNHSLTFAGITQCLTAWAEELGINKNTLRGRINAGWSVEKALTTPVVS